MKKPRLILTEEMEKYLIEIIPNRLTNDVIEMFKDKFGLEIKYGEIKRFKEKNKIKSGVKARKGIKLMSDEQIEYLLSIYKGISNEECTRMINDKFGTSYTREQIKNLKTRMKLNSGLTGRFEKGHVPKCPFKKGSKVGAETRFKKGDIPLNKLPLGTERIRKGGIYVKVADTKGKYSHINNWKPKQHIVWEQHYGEIPKGYAVTFLDGNSLNCNIDNLFLITLKENVLLSNYNYRSDNGELTKAGIGIIRLTNLIDEIEGGKTND